MRWYSKVTTAPDGDFVPLVEALAWYDAEYQRGLEDLKIEGKVIHNLSARIGGLMAYYYGVQQEIDGIHQWLEVIFTRTLHKRRVYYTQGYNLKLTDTQARQYAEADDEVLDIRLLINEVALRNRLFQGVTKGLEFIHFQISNMTKLRVAGIEDATI